MAGGSPHGEAEVARGPEVGQQVGLVLVVLDIAQGIPAPEIVLRLQLLDRQPLHRAFGRRGDALSQVDTSMRVEAGSSG